MERKDALGEYSEFLDLGEAMYECDKRKVVRKTKIISEVDGKIVTQIIQDEVEFT